MRLFPILSGRPRYHARVMQKEPIPFQEILPLKLKATVSGKGTKTSSVCCIQEMSVLFACLSSNEYEQSPCQREIESFKKCYNDYTREKAKKIDRDMKGILTPGEKNLTPKQLNLLLKSYPQV
ncbi:hypothetical protein ABEB36_003537 [Hypothenemus hampei]|uniref:CHCH domain-containing protein n=1 Tax=Hypothenemus hampei TaxID=57062 RepID=A0ABD1FC47_HYPHA